MRRILWHTHLSIPTPPKCLLKVKHLKSHVPKHSSSILLFIVDKDPNKSPLYIHYSARMNSVSLKSYCGGNVMLNKTLHSSATADEPQQWTLPSFQRCYGHGCGLPVFTSRVCAPFKTARRSHNNIARRLYFNPT